jgi:hypothetical protein
MNTHKAMATKVTPISTLSRVDEGGESGEIVSPVDLSMVQEGLAVLLAAMSDLGLEDDLRSIWAAYPNLQDATSKLLNRISIAWPSRLKPSESAIVVAATKAVEAVKRGIAVGDRSRAQVVATYLNALATVADDVAAIRAWGYLGKNQERWTLEDGDLWVWAGGRRFTGIKFFAVDDPNPNDVAGTRIKLLCAIATTRDVGLLGRYP